MSQRVKTSARGLVLPRSSSPENGHLRKNTVSFIFIPFPSGPNIIDSMASKTVKGNACFLQQHSHSVNPLAAGGTHVSISTLPEGHICPKSIDLTTFSLANKIYHIHLVVFFKDQVDVDVIPLRHYVTSRAIMT